MISSTPYINLSPDLILNAIESQGLQCTGGLLALNSYENRVYQVDIENAAPIIAKFYRPGRWSDECILEEHQFALELAEQEIPVVAPWQNANGNTLHTYEDFRFAIFPRKSGRPLELDNLDQLEWLGRFIGRIHAVGASDVFEHRIKLDVKTYGHEPYRFLLEHDFIPAEIRANYTRTVEHLLSLIQQRFAELRPIKYIRIHGDMHSGNVLWSDGPHIVDLDDCLMGPPIQDIWMLLSGNETQIREELDHILTGYEQFYEFDWESKQLIEPLRTLRMLNYSAWIAKRWNDPAFPRCFPSFNTPHYWQQQLDNFNEQLGLLDLT